MILQISYRNIPSVGKTFCRPLRRKLAVACNNKEFFPGWEAYFCGSLFSVCLRFCANLVPVHFLVLSALRHPVTFKTLKIVPQIGPCVISAVLMNLYQVPLLKYSIFYITYDKFSILQCPYLMEIFFWKFELRQRAYGKHSRPAIPVGLVCFGSNTYILYGFGSTNLTLCKSGSS